MNSILKLILSLALPLALGAIAGMFTAKVVPEWYAALNRPSFAPPNAVFGPVWTALYVLMGLSLFLIWKTPVGSARNTAMIIFFVQLLLNFGWSFLFFYFKNIGLALAEIIILWVFLALMIFLFYRVRPLAAYINIPYFLWVTFAAFLNGAYFRLN